MNIIGKVHFYPKMWNCPIVRLFKNVLEIQILREKFWNQGQKGQSGQTMIICIVGKRINFSLESSRLSQLSAFFKIYTFLAYDPTLKDIFQLDSVT